MAIDPKTAKEHADKFDELRKSSPIAAGIYRARHGVAISQHENRPDPIHTKPNRPATPVHDEAERLATAHNKIAAGLYRTAHPFELRAEQLALHAWERELEPAAPTIADALTTAKEG